MFDFMEGLHQWHDDAKRYHEEHQQWIDLVVDRNPQVQNLLGEPTIKDYIGALLEP